MVVIRKSVGPFHPAFVTVCFIACALDYCFFNDVLSAMEAFTSGADEVSVHSGTFGLIGIIGFNAMPIAAFIVYLRQDFRKQTAEAFMFYAGLFVLVGPLLLAYPIMRIWAEEHDYYLSSIRASERALPGSTYTFQKRR